MGCSSCGSGGGCSTGSSGGCGKTGGCASGGCNKMNSFDWLGNMDQTNLPKFNIVEVRFKGGRKEFFRNNNALELFIGDPVIVEVSSGHHLGHVALQGELVRLQMKKKNVADDENIKTIYRIATEKDLEKFESARKRESATLFRTRQIISSFKLEMKLTDVEFQADNTKATFYYSADDRVDFRELIKMLATEFKIRVDMRQISLRQEAGRLGGIGSCGRELCCSTWLTEFKSVSTSAARYQNLSLNPTKLSGQCGRLKCCLNYELETYVEALKDIPEIEEPLLTIQGSAQLQKTDIFKKIMWFGYKEESSWYPLNVKRVNEIIELNKKGVKPFSLEMNEAVKEDAAVQTKAKEDLTRFDDKFQKTKKHKKKKRKGPGQEGNQGSTQSQNMNKPQGSAQPQANKPHGQQQGQRPRPNKPQHPPRPQIKPEGNGPENK